MRKTVVCLTLAVFSMLLLTGCAGYLEYMSRSSKCPLNGFTDTRYHVEDYEVLGAVKATGRSIVVLGVYVKGEEGVGLLWEEAIEKFGNKVTGIKDVTAVSDYTGVLPPVYGEIITTYIGTAVHEK